MVNANLQATAGHLVHVRLADVPERLTAELIVAKALDSRGQGRELAATLKLQAWQVKNHLTWARRFSMAELVAALEGAVDVELALKGSADSEAALLLWITNILRKS